jgi:hypothetical protein
MRYTAENLPKKFLVYWFGKTRTKEVVLVDGIYLTEGLTFEPRKIPIETVCRLLNDKVWEIVDEQSQGISN